MSVAFGEYVFDPGRRELRKHGVPLKVDPLQLDLLACFLAHPGRLLSKHELLEHVWEGRAVADNVLSVTVAKLRKALGHKSGEREYIENRYGRGYRFLPAVTQVADPQPNPQAPAAKPGPTTPLVGRAESLQRLEAALSRAVAGKGSICMLIGEPGIGKTRLAEALEPSARNLGASPVWGRCQAGDGMPPLWPFAQALRELRGSQLAERILQLMSARERDAAEAPSGLMQEFAFETNTLHRTVDDATQTLFQLSREQPLVLLLDDLQWADAMSLRLLSYLVDDIGRWPFLIVTTVRSTELAPESRRNHDLSRLLRHRNCERIEIARLRRSDIDEYVTAMFGNDVSEISSEVFARSEGNPFFMVELLRPWVGHAGPIAPEQLELSGLALDLVRQRVQALPEAARSVLSAASVIGHDFDLGLLSHVTERSHDELLEALDDSLANDTVIPSAEHAGAYAFDHELIREVLYADLPALERCRLHYRAGEGLVRRNAAGGEVTHAELAHHFLSALPQGDVAVAIDYARKAATAAHRVAATSDARAILRRALASLSFWVEPDPEVRTALLLELSMIERVLGDRASLEHVEQGIALAREHGFGALLALAGQCLTPAPGLLTHADAHSVLEAAAEVLPKSDETRRAIVLAHMAWTPPSCSSARQVNALLGEAEELAKRAGQQEAKVAVQSAKLFFLAGPETVTRAEAIADEMDREVRAGAASIYRTRAMSTATFRYIIAMQRGDRERMKRAIEERAGHLAKLQNIELQWHHERLLLVDRMNRGEMEGVALELAQLRERAQRFGLQAWRAVVAVDYGALLLRTGDAAPFAARIRSALTPAKTDLPSARSRKLRSMADFGFLDDLRAALAQISIESLYDLPHDRDYVDGLCNLAFASTAAGSREHTAALYELLLPYPQLYAVDISFHCNGSVAYFLGRLAHALGRDADARAHFELALERNTAFELAPAAAQTALELGSLLADSDRARSKQLLGRAEAAAQKLGMKSLAEAAARKLRAAS